MLADVLSVVNLVIVMMRSIEEAMVLVAMVLEELPSQNCFQTRSRGCVLKLAFKGVLEDLERSLGGCFARSFARYFERCFEKCSERCWRCFEKAFPVGEDVL